MKKCTGHIFCSWILLFSFIAGQYMVYAHQHYINKNIHGATHYSVKKSVQPTVSEKCMLCDSMHHVSMDMISAVTYVSVAGANFVFRTFAYDFISISLILSPGRAPPVVS